MSSFLYYLLYLLDLAGGNGLTNTVGFLNLFFILIFGFVLIGTRLYYSIGLSTFMTAVYVSLLYKALGLSPIFYYYLYQIATVFLLCAILGYTREIVLRADFATQTELAEARLAKEQDDLRYLDWLRRLAVFLRHEVRQPVAQINSSLELIQLRGADVSAHVASAFNGVQHVWNLIERASRATDAEAFVRQGQSQLINLHSAVRVLVDRLRKTISGMEFELQSLEDTILLEADPTLVEEAIVNVFQNAASFAETDSVIEVSIRSDGVYATVTVINRGPVIDGDTASCFRAFSSTRTGVNSEHHGLGLYLVRLIAEHYGGSASLSNLADGSGVRAAITFPIASRSQTHYIAPHRSELQRA